MNGTVRRWIKCGGIIGPVVLIALIGGALLRPIKPALSPNLAAHGDYGQQCTTKPGCEPKHLTALSPSRSAESRRAECAYDAEHERRSLFEGFQEARTAQATEQGVWEGFYQARAIWIQTVLLFLAFAASVWAAFAASRAAHVAERALFDLERSWLIFEGTTITRRAPPDQPNEWFISLMWKNAGRAPAIVESCIAVIAPTETLAENPDYNGCFSLVCQNTVSPNDSFETNAVGPGAAKTGKDGKPIRYVMYGKLTYKDLGGAVHETGFAIEVSAHVAAASPYHRKSYSYYT